VFTKLLQKGSLVNTVHELWQTGGDEPEDDMEEKIGKRRKNMRRWKRERKGGLHVDCREKEISKKKKCKQRRMEGRDRGGGGSVIRKRV